MFGDWLNRVNKKLKHKIHVGTTSFMLGDLDNKRNDVISAKAQVTSPMQVIFSDSFLVHAAKE
jgi:hypothetical protein